MDPRRPRALIRLTLGLALCYLGACDSPQPAAPAEAERADPAAAAPTPALALAYVPGEGADEATIAAAQARLRATPDAVAAHVALATAFIRRSRQTGDASYRRYAEDVLRAARARDPQDGKVALLLAGELHADHRFAAAAELARAAIARSPDDSTGHIVLGDALLEQGEYDAAIDAYQAAMEIRPDLRTYERAGYLRWLQGDVDGAREIYAMAIEAGSPRDSEARAWCFVDLAELDLARGEDELAGEDAFAALQLVPDYLPALSVQARIAARAGRRYDAIELLTAVVDRKPSVEELVRLVELLELEGRSDEARSRMAEAEALATGDPRPLAHHFARLGHQPARALALAEAELDSRRTLAAHDTHALALLRVGRIVDAQAAMTAALRLGTPDATWQLHAGLIARAAGDLVGARAALSRALAMDPEVDPRLVSELRRAVGEA